MKKLSLILLSVIILLTGSCNTWMQDDNFYSDIENDVKVANAKQISVYVRYAMTRQGKTDPDGSATFKVEIPHEISATTEPEYGFVRWAAFPTSYLATGDNQSKNKDIYFIDEDDYNERILPNEIQSPQVVFEDATKPTTSVKINVERNDIYLCPIVAQRPVVSLTIPAKGSSGVVRNMTVRINFSKPMDPESFKNEAGVYDKITVTQGIQSFSADGDIEVSSEDITNRFREPEFSANGKMVTLKFTEEAISEGYASQSSVNITISKDVKDIYGFSMADDDKISFSVGSSMDTLAPRITDLTAGTAINNFHKFKGMYKDADTWNAIQAYTKMEAHLHGSTYLGSANAPTNNIDNAFFDTFAPADTPENANNEGYRVTNKLYIRVFAEDIAGSGSNQDQTGIESDVTMIGIRATPMYDADGNPSTAESVFRASNYMPQANMTGEPGVYKNLIQAVNGQIPGTDNDFAEDKGCLYTFDLSSLPDGLIRVDVAAVDMVQNNGFSDGGALSAEYGNGYATLFVVKDTTPPDAAALANFVIPSTDEATPAHYFNNISGHAHNTTKIRITGDTSSLQDSGLSSRLHSKHDSLKWIVRLRDDENWRNELSTSSGWSPVTTTLENFTPTAQGEIPFTYALMDDMGNISSVARLTPSQPVYYDSIFPAFQNLSFVADPGNTVGSARDNILNTQTLVIPLTETGSGIKTLEIQIKKKTGVNADGSPILSGAYATPFAAQSVSGSGFGVWVDGASESYTAAATGNTLTFANNIIGENKTVTIKGLKITDATGTDKEGAYYVFVKATDAADNPTTTTLTQTCVVNIDSVSPSIEDIYIPNLKKTERHPTSTAEYWIDYTKTNNTYGTPRTDVLVKFTEVSSGAKIFDFTGSSIKLTPESMIYKISNAEEPATTGVAIPATVETDATGVPTGRLIINSAQDAATYFTGTSIAVKITNVELAPEGTASTISLKIHDTATNVAASPSSEIKSNEGSMKFATPTITTTNFKFDSAIPGVSTPHGSLFDRDDTESVSTATSAEGKTAAETGYTNETYVNETITLTPTASGIDSLTIVGDAVFFKDESNPANPNNTTIYIGTTPVYFNITNSGKTVTFKKAESDNTHIILAPAAGSTTVSITINNLLLTSGDGAKSVTVKPRSFGGLADATGANDTIILDTIPPTWGGPVPDGATEGTGLYAAYNSSLTSASIYPHPVSGSKVYGLININSSAQNDIYFYRYSSICIKPEISDSNPKAVSTLIEYKDSSGSVLSNNNEAFSPSSSYGYTSSTGTFTATARDRAGNKSTVKTFHIVGDTSFASPNEINDIKNYFALSKPDTANVWRNTASSSSVKYIIRGINNTSVNDTEIKVKVKLGSGVSTTDTDKRIDGNPHPDDKTEYSRRTTKTDSSPIEYYGVALNGYSFSSWNKYEPSSSDYATSYGTTTIHSNVDENGNIEIKIPNKTCSYLKLYLKDGCGNTDYVYIADASNHYVEWEVDKEVCVEDYRGSANFNTSNLQNFADVTFYNTSQYLNILTCSDSVRFGSQHRPSTATEIANGEYTLRARIITWDGSSSPTQEDFHASTLTTQTASPWVGFQEGIQDQITDTTYLHANMGTSFDLNGIEFPKPNTTTPYQLWYILEDTVGNCRIEQIKRPSSTISYWLYDNTKPVVSNYQFYKINQVTDGSTTKNYYSDNSYVTYNITDSGSGLAYDGVNSLSYSRFDNRNRFIENKIKYLNYNTNSSSQLLLSNIKDNTGNYTDPASIPLSKDGITTWVRQSTAPALYSTTNTKKATAIQNSTFGGVSPTVESDSATSGQVLHIKAKSATLSVIAKFGVTDTTKLLGWKVTTSPITTSSTDFYEAGGLTQLTYDSTNNVYSTTYNKTNTLDYFTQWKDDTSGATKYYYPVNRAGLIGTPIKVEFVENLIPYITDAGLTYNTYGVVDTAADEPSTPKTITKEGEGTDAIYYIKSGAKLRFTTVNAPTTARIHYGTGNNDYVEYTLSENAVTGETNTYALPLDTSTLTSHLTSTSGTSLKLTLHTADEDSPEIPLNGPAAGSASNKWVYDSTKPTISAGNFISVGYDGSDAGTDDDEAATVSGDTTKYIQSDTTKITLTYSDGTSGTGIAHYQWKVGSEAWADIGTPLTQSTGVVEFSAPAAKTAYKFRVIDHAGNISTVDDAGTIQKDKWGPDGNLTYIADTDFDFTNLDKGELVGTERNEKIRIINYSNSSSNDRAHLNTITVNFAGITDKRNSSDEVSTGTDGIERSGIDHFEIEKNDPTPLFSDDDADKGTRTFDADTTTATINLSYSDGVSQYTYVIKAVDKLGQSTVLKTLKVRQDSQAPALSITTIHADEAKTIEAISSSNSSVTTKFLKGDKAVITFTIDDPDATYYYRAGTSGAWTPIAVSSENLSATSLKFTLDAPTTPTTYNFYAKDAIGNESPIRAVTLVQDITAPVGDVAAESFKNGNTAVTTGFVRTVSEGTPTDVSIKFNPNTINKLIVDASAVKTANDGTYGSGIEGFYFNNAVITTSGTATISSDGIITIALDNTLNNTEYTITVKDIVGNSRVLRTLRLTSDAEAPDFALDTTTPVEAVTGDTAGTIYQNGTSPYYIKGSHAKINFTKSHPDIASYWMQASTADPVQLTSATEGFSISDTAVTYQFAAPTTETTYKFYAKDNVGNQSDDITVALVQDITAPALKDGEAFTYDILNASDTAATAVSDTVKVGDYILSTEGTTTTITFNPDVVKKISFTNLNTKLAEYATSGANSGFAKLYYKGTGDLHDMDEDNDGVMQIGLSSSWTDKTYSIYAKDKAGNLSEALMTFVFKADNTAPAFTSDASEVYGATTFYGYADITISTGKVPKIGRNQLTNVYPTGTKLTVDKNKISAVQYQLATANPSTSESDPEAEPSADNWISLANALNGENYEFTLPTIDVPYTRLALCFRDEVGNVSKYYLGNKDGDHGIKWWITAPELSASNVRISGVEVIGDASKTGWQGKANYKVSIKLPVGTLVNSITLAPAENGTNTGVVWATASGINDQIQFTGFDPQNKPVTSLPTDKTYMNITNSSEVGLTLKIYVWDKKSSTENMERTDPKLSINGIELALFPEGGYGSFTSSGDSFITGGITSAGGRKAQDSDSGAQASGDSRDSRVTQFFNNISNAFISKPEVSTDTSLNEKPVTTAKKTAKKAAKKAKQTANATQKASTITAPAAAEETAEIITPNVISAVVETSVAAPEASVNETESSVVEAQVSADSTALPASEPAEKRVPSKSASIVIMLSILSSFGGVWYYKKSRKK